MDLAILPTAPTREAVCKLQDHLATLPQIQTREQHYFAPGQYVRVCIIPAGSCVVGKIHKHSHVVMLVRGTATINTDKGMETITGPHYWTSEVGAKRALVTHDECEFVTFHLNPGDSQDLEVLESELIEPETILLTAQEVLP